MRVGFLGLGHMGRVIARNLAAAGHEVLAWNRSPLEGIRLVSSVREALESDVAISMLADDQAVIDIVLGSVARFRSGQAHINMATISVALGKRLQAEHARLGSKYVSAPVFGRPEAAAAKKLFIVAGGDQATIAAAQPLFDATAQRTYNVGEDAYRANLIKICGNLLVAMAIEGLAETAALARHSGVDPAQMFEILSSSIFAVPVYQGYGRMIAERRYEPAHFKVPLGLKDVELAREAGAAAGAALPSADLLREHLLTAIERGFGEKDWSVLAEIV
jgi:3-hydroxyisobutyrate dehydrogenase-like beta-hydroxyacid dehydrogenase